MTRNFTKEILAIGRLTRLKALVRRRKPDVELLPSPSIRHCDYDGPVLTAGKPTVRELLESL